MSFTDYFRPSDWPYQSGQTIVVIGPAEGGPTQSPIVVQGDPAAIFGGGPLVETIRAGQLVGPEMQWVGIRLNGTVTRVALPAFTGEVSPSLVLESVAGTDAYNGLAITINWDSLGAPTLTLPGGSTYRLSDYTHLGQLTEVMNRDALYGRSAFWAYTGYPDLPAYRLVENPGSYLLTGGSSDLTPSRDDLFLRLADTLDLIDGRPTDAVVLAGAYFDDLHQQNTYGGGAYGSAVYGSDPPGDRLTLIDAAHDNRPVSYHGLLAEWAARQLYTGRVVAGFIACRPLRNPALLITADIDYVATLVQHVTSLGGAALTGSDGKDIGRFLQIVAGEAETSTGAFTMEAVAAVAYLRAVISGPTNSPVPVQLHWEIDTPQRDRIAEVGISTFYADAYDQTRLWSGVTAALAHNDFHWSANLRQVQLVIAAVLEHLDRFIGADFRATYLSRQVDREIEAVMSGFRQAGIVSEYTFSVEYIPLKKEVRLDLSLLPKQGVEAMHVDGQVVMA